MYRLFLGVALATLPLTTASAQEMNAEVFHQRASALQSKGALALLSRGEIRALMGEARAAGEAARDMRLQATREGRAPPYCPPGGQTGMAADEFMTRLSAIPAAERRKMSMAEATLKVLATKFPCRS